MTKRHIKIIFALLLFAIILLSGCQRSSHEVTLEPKASQETMEFWEENREDFNDLAKALLTLAEEYEGPRVYREAISLGYEKYYEKLGLTSPYAQYDSKTKQYSDSVVLFSAGIGGKGCNYYWIDQEDLETSSCWEVDFRGFRSRGIDPTYTLQGGSENPALIFCMPGISAGEKDLYPADIHEIFIVTPK